MGVGWTREDLRTAFRYATKPTGHVRGKFAEAPEHWLRVTALVTAASLSHTRRSYEIPAAMLGRASAGIHN